MLMSMLMSMLLMLMMLLFIHQSVSKVGEACLGYSFLCDSGEQCINNVCTKPDSNKHSRQLKSNGTVEWGDQCSTNEQCVSVLVCRETGYSHTKRCRKRDHSVSSEVGNPHTCLYNEECNIGHGKRGCCVGNFFGAKFGHCVASIDPQYPCRGYY